MARVVVFACMLLMTLTARADGRPLVVSAAASLSDVLPKVAQAWGKAPVTFNFDASSRLATQLSQGARADVFVSADREWMNFLVGKQLVETPVELLGNTLVVVVPADAAFVPAGAKELENKAIRHVALAGENVPAGRYAREALVSLGVWPALRARVVNGANVRQALEYVARGEAEAAIVYRSDVIHDPRVRQAFAIDPSTHAPIVYPVAVLRRAPQHAEAEAFVRFLRGAEARALFEQAGFRLLAAP